jgi:hypothetical protein
MLLHLNKPANFFVGMLIFCMIFAGASKVVALELYLSPTNKTHYPPEEGDPVTFDVMLDGLNEQEYIYNLSLAIDYDRDVIIIKDARFPGGFPSGGDIEHHFNDFNTDPSQHTDAMNTVESNFDPPVDAIFAGKNVQRYIYGATVNKVAGGTPGVDEFPFQRPASGLPASLMTITFTVQSRDSTDATDLFMVLAKVEASDRDGTNYTVNTGNAHLSLPVEMSMFSAIGYPNGIEVVWEAESQRENLGWNVYRSESIDGQFEKVNTKVIEGDGTTSVAKTYKFVDSDAQKGKSYFYYLESIAFDGETEKSDIVEVKFVNTSISWGAIKKLATQP